MLALQRRVGNDAVRTLAEGQVVVQRQLPFLVPALIGLAGYGAYKALGGGGGEPAPTPAATPTPDPVLQALAKEGWENGVSKPIEEAYLAMAEPRPDYNRARVAAGRAYDFLQKTRDDALRATGLVHPGILGLVAQLTSVTGYMVAKMGFVTDTEMAENLRGLYYQSQVIGQEQGLVDEPAQLLREATV